MATKAQLNASAKYDKQNTKGIYLKLNLKTDADIIKFLDSTNNVQGFIKDLIRSELNRKK